MRYYTGIPCLQVDLSELLKLIRNGEIYSLTVKEEFGEYIIRGEVVVRGEGIQQISLVNVGRTSFSSEEEANRLLLKALTPEKPLKVNAHLANPNSPEEMLCGIPKYHRGKPIKATDPEVFFNDEINIPGGRCSRCKTQGFVLGLDKSGSD